MNSAISKSTRLDDVPIELFVSKILNYFGENELQRLRGVSNRWKNTIDGFFGRTITINSSNWNDLKSDVNLKRVILEYWNNATIIDAVPSLGGLKELVLLNPNELLGISNLSPLFSCESLTTLVIHRTYTGNVRSKDSQHCIAMSSSSIPEDVVVFPRLTTLKFINEINERRYSNYTEFPEIQETGILEVLFKTLAATKSLLNLDITMLNSNWGLPLTIIFHTNPTAAISLTSENYSAIPILRLGLEKLSQLESFILRTHCEDVEISMYFYSITEHDQLTCDIGQLKNPRSRQLRKFMKSGYIKETKSPRFNFITNLNMSDLWMDILETQFNLEEIEYELILGEPDQNLERLVRVLQRNRMTLRRLKLFNTSRRLSQPNLWSGRDFSGLEKLEYLSLVNLCRSPRPSNSPSKQQQLISVIKDLEYLPSTLKYLELHCPFEAREQDISTMFKSLSNLETLKLISNESDKTWWIHKDEPKWILDVKELEILITSLRRIKLFDIFWRPPTIYGSVRISSISYSLQEDQTLEIADKKLRLLNFPLTTYKLMHTHREFRRCKITVVS